MAGKDLAIKDSVSVSISPPEGSPWTPGTPSLIKITSPYLKCSGEEVLITTLAWVMAGCTFSPNVFTAGGGSMSPTGSLCTCNNGLIGGQLPLRKGDSGSCVGAFAIPSGGSAPCNCTVEIDNAGQTKVKAS